MEFSNSFAKILRWTLILQNSYLFVRITVLRAQFVSPVSQHEPSLNPLHSSQMTSSSPNMSMSVQSWHFVTCHHDYLGPSFSLICIHLFGRHTSPVAVRIAMLDMSHVTCEGMRFIPPTPLVKFCRIRTREIAANGPIQSLVSHLVVVLVSVVIANQYTKGIVALFSFRYSSVHLTPLPQP